MDDGGESEENYAENAEGDIRNVTMGIVRTTISGLKRNGDIYP